MVVFVVVAVFSLSSLSSSSLLLALFFFFFFKSLFIDRVFLFSFFTVFSRVSNGFIFFRYEVQSRHDTMPLTFLMQFCRSLVSEFAFDCIHHGP